MLIFFALLTAWWRFSTSNFNRIFLPCVLAVFHDINTDGHHEFDIVIDAIDDMRAKVAVANSVKNILISSMGSAKKLDPTKIKVTSIWKTHTDKLAKKFRYELKKSGFKGDFLVIFSDEEAQCEEMGSFVGVTGAFGLTLCAIAINSYKETEIK